MFFGTRLDRTKQIETAEENRAMAHPDRDGFAVNAAIIGLRMRIWVSDWLAAAVPARSGLPPQECRPGFAYGADKCAAG
jgi:hypothetical protein